MSTERIRYIRDTQTWGRVMTVVSKKNEDGSLLLGVAVNRPTTWKATVTRTTMSAELVRGDQFNKKEGRRLAGERLATAPILVEAGEGAVFDRILEQLSKNDCKLIARIAQTETSIRRFFTLMRAQQETQSELLTAEA